jgi:predicted RNA-binding protein YlxR (DUF448 family)
MSAGTIPHAPVRMCAACRQRFPKARLLRHTRSPLGNWMPDDDQTRPGRGRYLCSDPGCRERFARAEAKGRAAGLRRGIA